LQRKKFHLVRDRGDRMIYNIAANAPMSAQSVTVTPAALLLGAPTTSVVFTIALATMGCALSCFSSS